MAKYWYVIHTQTGYEQRVKKNLDKKLEEKPEFKEFISKVMIPTEQIAEVKSGKKKITERVCDSLSFYEFEGELDLVIQKLINLKETYSSQYSNMYFDVVYDSDISDYSQIALYGERDETVRYHNRLYNCTP